MPHGQWPGWERLYPPSFVSITMSWYCVRIIPAFSRGSLWQLWGKSLVLSPLIYSFCNSWATWLWEKKGVSQGGITLDINPFEETLGSCPFLPAHLYPVSRAIPQIDKNPHSFPVSSFSSQKPMALSHINSTKDTAIKSVNFRFDNLALPGLPLTLKNCLTSQLLIFCVRSGECTFSIGLLWDNWVNHLKDLEKVTST